MAEAVIEPLMIMGQAAIGGETEIKVTIEIETNEIMRIVAVRAGQAVSGLAVTVGIVVEKAGLTAVRPMKAVRSMRAIRELKTASALINQTPKKSAQI